MMATELVYPTRTATKPAAICEMEKGGREGATVEEGIDIG